MKRKQNGFISMPLIIAIGVIVVIVIFFLLTGKGSVPVPEKIVTPQITQNVPAIQDTSGLNTAATELDNTDLNAVDKELDQLDAETSTF